MLNETLEYIGIAFVSSAILIVLSKIILQSLIRRPADYYAAEELRQEELMLNAGGLSIFSEHETTPEGETIETSHLEPHMEWPDDISGIVERHTKPEHDRKHAPEAEEEPHKEHIWEESYDEIRRSLEAAFAGEAAKQSAESEAEAVSPEEPVVPEPISEPEPETETVPEAEAEPMSEPEEKPQIPMTKSGKPRKPSMKMKKDELTAIAESMGIEIPAKTTKAVILELINANDNQE